MSKEHPKVYFSNSFLESCYFVRCLLPLIAGGWDGDRTTMRGEVIPPEMRAKAVLDSDIVVFHRPNDWRSKAVALELRKMGKKICCDNDDTYKGLEGKNLAKALSKVDAGLDDFCRMADLVTCSTEFLAKEYRKINKNVVVLPNCVDPDIWPDPERNEGDKVRLGFVGSVASNGDYNEITDVIKTLSDRKDVQLVVFALPPVNPDKTDTEGFIVRELYKADYDFWQSLNIEWHPFAPMKDYFEILNDLKLDVMVIPRRDDYFNSCKSNLKFLEASMLRIPCIGQGFLSGNSPYQVDPEDGQFMTVVTDNTKWLEEIDKLVKDKELRRGMGDKAHDYVIKKYSIDNNIEKWTTAYQSLLS